MLLVAKFRCVTVLISPGIVIFREVPLTGLIFTWPGGSALARLCRALLIIGEWCFFGLLTFNMISFIHSSVWSAAKVWLKYRAINLQTTNNCFTSPSPPTRRGRPQAAALDPVMALMRIWRQLSLRRGKDGVKFNETASMTLYGLWLSISISSYTTPHPGTSSEPASDMILRIWDELYYEGWCMVGARRWQLNGRNVRGDLLHVAWCKYYK